MTRTLLAAAFISLAMMNVSPKLPMLAEQPPRAEYISIGIDDRLISREDIERKIEAERAEAERLYREKALNNLCFSEQDVIAVAKMLWGEARGCALADKQNCVRTVCNRCDDARYPNTPYAVVTQRSQYYGYSASNPVDDELYAIAEEILTDWSLRKWGFECEWNYYNSFSGNGTSNYFYVN